jgi:hypothetical protein
LIDDNLLPILPHGFRHLPFFILTQQNQIAAASTNYKQMAMVNA